MLTAALIALSLAADPAALDIGSKAPPMAQETWIKGDAVNGFEPGKIYVVARASRAFRISAKCRRRIPT